MPSDNDHETPSTPFESKEGVESSALSRADREKWTGVFFDEPSSAAVTHRQPEAQGPALSLDDARFPPLDAPIHEGRAENQPLAEVRQAVARDARPLRVVTGIGNEDSAHDLLNTIGPAPAHGPLTDAEILAHLELEASVNAPSGARGQTNPDHELTLELQQLMQVYGDRYQVYVQHIPNTAERWHNQLRFEQSRATAIKQQFLDRHKLIKVDESLSKDEKELARLAAHVTSIKDQDKLRQSIQSERAAFRELARTFRLPTFEEYLTHISDSDDRVKRLLPRLEQGPEETPLLVVPPFGTHEKALQGLRFSRNSNGIVTYALPNGRSFESHPDHLECRRFDQPSIRAQLELARLRFDNAISITGTKKYQAMVVREAARLGITIANPELQEQYARELATIKEENKSYSHDMRAAIDACAAAPVVFYGAAEKHHAAYLEHIRQAAWTVARDRNPNLELLDAGHAKINGAIKDAWTIGDRTYAILRAGRSDYFVDVPSSQMHDAHLSIDSAAVMARGTDGEPRLLVGLTNEDTRAQDVTQQQTAEVDLGSSPLEHDRHTDHTPQPPEHVPTR